MQCNGIALVCLEKFQQAHNTIFEEMKKCVAS